MQAYDACIKPVPVERLLIIHMTTIRIGFIKPRCHEYFIKVGRVATFIIFGTHCSCQTYSYLKTICLDVVKEERDGKGRRI